MNIAFLSPEYVTESNFDGGLASYLYRVAQGMKERGHHVEIFTSANKKETITHNGITVHRTNINSNIFFIFNYLTRHKFKTILYILLQAHLLRNRLLKRHKFQCFDVIQTSSYLACGLFLTFNRPAPIITRVSSYAPLWRKYSPFRNNIIQKFVEWLELAALRRSNAVYVPSRLLAEILEHKEGIKTDVLQPPFRIETDYFDETIYEKFLSGKRYFLFYGTIRTLKGSGVIARVLPIILSKYPDMYFVFAGKDSASFNGPSMLQYILQQTGNYKKQIVYLGVLRFSQLYPIIKHSQAVVLPSLIDNLPNTMLEAMALGKIVIGTQGASFEELIEDGISGILIEPNNPSELSKAMERIWHMSDEEQEKIGHEAQKCIKFLSPEITCNKLEQYFQKVLDKYQR